MAQDWRGVGDILTEVDTREAAVLKAAELNKLPIHSITEVPVTLSPK